MRMFFQIVLLAALLSACPLQASEPVLPPLDELVQGGLDDAEDFIDEHVKRYPEHAQGHFYRGNILYLLCPLNLLKLFFRPAYPKLSQEALGNESV